MQVQVEEIDSRAALLSALVDLPALEEGQANRLGEQVDAARRTVVLIFRAEETPQGFAVLVDEDGDRSIEVQVLRRSEGPWEFVKMLRFVEAWAQDEGYFCLFGRATNAQAELRAAYATHAYLVKALDQTAGDAHLQVADYCLRHMKMIAAPEALP